MLPGLLIRECPCCSLRISEIDPDRTVAAEFSRIDDGAYERAIGAVRREQAKAIVSAVTARDELPASGEGAAWLDVGCSFGHLLGEAREAGFEVFGIEPDEKAHAAAVERLGADSVALGLLEPGSRPEASADLISMLDVLEHVPLESMTEVATTVKRTLRPGGLWVIKVPTTEGLYYRVAHGLRPLLKGVVAGVLKRLWQFDYEFPHVVYFDRGSLTAFLHHHGFEPIEHRYLLDVPNSTIRDRIAMDDTIPDWQGGLLVPVFRLINAIESIRGKTDALLMIARRANEQDPVGLVGPDPRSSRARRLGA